MSTGHVKTATRGYASSHPLRCPLFPTSTALPPTEGQEVDTAIMQIFRANASQFLNFVIICLQAMLFSMLAQAEKTPPVVVFVP